MTHIIPPLKLKNQLAPTPQQKPRYSIEIKDAHGKTDHLPCPNVSRALVALMNQHAIIGGAAAHWGGPSALAEIMSSLHAHMFKHSPWYEKYNFVNDAGHTENGVYAVRANYGFDQLTFNDLKGFRSLESKLTGHGEAHLNPEGVYISNGPLGSGLPQAQGLALADGLTQSQRTTLCVLSDGGAMEGEAREAMAAIPGLAQKGKLAPFVLIISDNNTKLSGRIDQDSYSMQPSFKALETLGWDCIEIDNGHDLSIVHPSLQQAIEQAEAQPQKPVAIIFKTIKGKGVKSTEESSSGGHGYPLKAYDEKLEDFLDEIFSGNTPSEFKDWAQSLLQSKPQAQTPSSNTQLKEKVQVGLSQAAIKAAQGGKPVFSVSADLQGSTGIAGFHKEFPQQSLDVGVAEANMISTAVGLSKQGFIPIVDTFSQFAITKGNLPLIMAGLSQAPIIGLLSHIGFQDAADGASHQATTYYAAVSSIPHVQVITLSCSSEAEALLTSGIDYFQSERKAGRTPDSLIYFLGRENHLQSYVDSPHYQWGSLQVLTEGKDALILTCGPHVPYALRAAKRLREKGKSVTVVNNPFINRPNIKELAPLLKQAGSCLITLEDHQIIGGMGAQVCHALKRAGEEFKLVSLGQRGEFGRSAYKAEHLYQKEGMDDNAILKAMEEF